MTPFDYVRPRSLDGVMAALARAPEAGILAGGTCLIDLMKQGALHPRTVIDLSFVPELRRVDLGEGGTLTIAAATPLSAAARDPRVLAGWPLLHDAIVAGLTPQLRNAATIGGNIMQRPRCIYFREPGFACEKRVAGSGCAAQAGVHYAHALFGGDEAKRCIAVHPSDLCVALTALEAEVQIRHLDGERTTRIDALHRLAGDEPGGETTLRPGELITSVRVPPQGARGSAYVKGTEGFTLASCAALVGLADGVVVSVRIVFGGVAHKPWRSMRAEGVLQGRRPDAAAIAAAQDAALADARTDEQTEFRRPLLRAVMGEALTLAIETAGRPR